MKRASARGGRWWLVVAGIEFLSFDTWREAYDYAYTQATEAHRILGLLP